MILKGLGSKLINRLEQYSRVCAHIDLDAILHNLEQMHAHIDADTRIMAVIKADAYGHGSVPIAWEMEELSYVHGYGVASVEEAMQLRNANIRKPILVLGYTFPYSYETLINQEITPAVFRRDVLGQLNEIAGKMNVKAPIHIKVDTGMTRIGIRPDEEGEAFVKEALACENLIVEGIFTHFSKADETDKTFANGQLNTFRTFVDKCEKDNNFKFRFVHCSNSAGIIDMPDANMDLVRAGIILYGMWPSNEVSRDALKLEPVLSLKSHIVYVKDVEAGIPVSYNGTYITENTTRIATIPVGYADGYPRNLSNAGTVIICGKRAPIIGRVCMDQFMVDVTHIPECKEGDEVTLIGRDGDECITIEELGDISGRFNYEFACEIGKRTPRVFFRHGKPFCAKDYYDDVKIKKI